ncbi:beta-glucosidase H [Leifsonia aquatica]|uniref:Beta-glucosidase n=2 Tax=Leifsonia aquatica TaxID=144185 RepID=A0A7W4UYX4_LEIAQ|nr:glycoside hydrolase family 3 C-terminal domain-containing protein [Leifsonia aquatica]ERK70681.1 putative beta-glucosidase [Leifsonia aquatica ATCC 14665]MBB2968833.1 beta-glucosidase [Leifsonia aquatica]
MTDTITTEDVIAGLLGSLSLEQKVRLLTGASFWTLHDEPQIGLDTIVVSDGPAGIRGQVWDERDASANLPSPTALAASWDVERVYRLGQLIAAEARRKGVGVALGPTVNIQRSPRGGRHFEAFSEDPWLSGVVGTAYVQGVQSGGVGATPKHFVANDSETDRMTVDVQVDERTLREVYLAPFERMVVEGGAWLVMSSYNSVNGVTMTENELLRSPLKDEWGFDGVVVSDWMGVRDTIAAAVSSQDLAMPGPQGVWGDALVEAVRAGSVAESDVDEKVRRILRLAGRLGALDGVEAATPLAEPWPQESVDALLREAAADGMVLVRNEGGLLPLAADGSVAVIGQHARVARSQGGGSATVFPQHVVTPLDGIEEAFGADRVRFAPGAKSTESVLPLDARVAVDPVTGEPGVHVRFLDADGGVVLDEHRLSGRLTWLGDPVLGETAVVEATATFTAPEDGEYAVGFAGLGLFRFEVDGELKSDGLFFPDGTDPFMAFLNPPKQSFPVQLTAGQTVELRLEHRPQMQAGLAAVMFTFGYEEPFADPEAELERAVALAAESETAIVVVGTTETLESEGFDRAGLSLPDGQDELVRRVLAVNPRTVVVVNSGGPVILPWLSEAPAVLLTWFPGQEMGGALADVLTGTREPGGRIPTTWAASEDDVPVWQVEPVDGKLFYDEKLNVGYREWVRREQLGGPAPAIPFGHGLGYTEWELGEAAVDGLTAGIPVTNTGERAGKQVVQAYLSRVSASEVERPVLWLAGYAVVHAQPGETVTATITVEPRSLQHWSIDDHAWRTEPGTYALTLGTSVAALGAPVEFTV